MHLLCTCYAPAMHLLCTCYAPAMHLLCTCYAPALPATDALPSAMPYRLSLSYLVGRLVWWVVSLRLRFGWCVVCVVRCAEPKDSGPAATSGSGDAAAADKKDGKQCVARSI
jgi:hypothetical protein